METYLHSIVVFETSKRNSISGPALFIELFPSMLTSVSIAFTAVILKTTKFGKEAVPETGSWRIFVAELESMLTDTRRDNRIYGIC